TRDRTRMAVRREGRPARTEYEVLATDPDGRVALLECRLETGRTHQIRVHLAAIDHPVLGDPAYGAGPAPAGLDRPFLHAHALTFPHPTRGTREAHAAPLPADLVAVLDTLGVEGGGDRAARAGDVGAG
ncbi:MAG TPA: pseudouridine synthase, partial [Acidimicrobiia bacterium]|nr:pseudouridine synthase [Acidimicrobiia bacterium]